MCVCIYVSVRAYIYVYLEDLIVIYAGLIVTIVCSRCGWFGRVNNIVSAHVFFARKTRQTTIMSSVARFEGEVVLNSSRS